MQIVIDIPEGNYKTICETKDLWETEPKNIIYVAIANGTPLPKGHGRLMILSENEVKRELTSLNFSCQNWISEVGLWNATLAIIEADKENEKDEHMTANKFAELFTGNEELGMSDSFEFTLHSPLTKEDWNKISDVEYENTMFVTFQTPQGRQVRYIKCEVLNKIRAEIADIAVSDGCGDYLLGFNFGLMRAALIIDKYKAESEVKDETGN